MKIFISWSGERSEALAKAFRDWMQLVLHYAQPWLSQSDIKAGDRWSVQIAKELDGCNFGIICITRENLSAPWILFEAGALAKSMQEGRVIPVLLDLELKDLSGPLAQFQAKKCDLAGIKELMLDLNKQAPSPVPDANFERLFNMAWGELEKQILNIPKSGGVVKASRSQGEILEELVAGIRNVEMRIRDSSEDIGRSKRRRGRPHPEELHYVMHKIDFRGGKALRLVVLFSYLKDDFPWMFELALEAFRATRSGSRQRAREARETLIESFQVVRSGPFRDMMFEDKYTHMLIREIEMTMHHELDDISDGDDVPLSPQVEKKS